MSDYRVKLGSLSILMQSLKKAQALVKRYAKNKNLVEKLKKLRRGDTSINR